MKKINACVLAFLVIGLGCRASSKSEIVVQAEAAGLGDLKDAEEESVQIWMAIHVDLAEKLALQCDGIMKNGFNAKWMRSPEGIVCTAAVRVANSSVLFNSPSYNPYPLSYIKPQKR